jgi:hypothetical protein
LQIRQTYPNARYIELECDSNSDTYAIDDIYKLKELRLNEIKEINKFQKGFMYSKANKSNIKLSTFIRGKSGTKRQQP